MLKKTVSLLFCFLFIHFIKAQHQLKIITVDSVSLTSISSIKSNFSTNNNCKAYLNQFISNLKAKGYITASFDSIVDKPNFTTVYFFLGKKYNWQNINLPTEINFLTNQVLIEDLPKKILEYYSNNGYPFANLNFDSVSIVDGKINANLIVNKGIYYLLDSLNIVGDVSISQAFLQKYLGITPKMPFSQIVIKQIDEKINQLSFVSTSQPTSVLMLNNGYIINVHLQPKKVNRFDVIFGLLPNNSQTNGKLLFTIDANVGLVNSFGKGETIGFMWQQIQPQSPRIDLGFAMPYVFKSNAQFNFKFNLYKRDSAFLNINSQIGLGYDINKRTKFSIFLNQFSSRLIQPDTLSIKALKQLPSSLDVNITNLGFEYYFNKLNTNFSKNLEIKFISSFGQKIIKENTTITSIKNQGFNFKQLYDTVNKSTYQLKAQLMVSKYIHIKQFAVLKFQINAATIQTSQMLQNEQYQIGGFKLLRGFDEENIFTNQYLVASTEYRLLLNRSSYFYVFNDLGFTQNTVININHNFISGGLGLALQTKQGILNFCLANGKRNDLPFNFRETKIHIGLTSGL